MKNCKLHIRYRKFIQKRTASFLRRLICFAVANIYFLSYNIQLYSAFENINEGARPISLGNAFTALSDDVNAIQSNPAGLSQITTTELTASFGKLYLGISDQSDISSSFFAAAQPIRKWNLGTFAVGYSDLNLTGFYKEDLLYLSYAKNISDSLLSGISLKRLHRSAEPDIYTARDPIFQRYGLSTSALAFDFGLIYKFQNNLSLGFVMKNFNRPDIGLASEDRIPVEYRAGAFYRWKTFNYAFDLGKKSDIFNYSLGGEGWFMSRYALRMGLDFDTNDKRNVSAGLGYKFNNFQMDYSFLMPLTGIKGTAGSHKFSILLRFDFHSEQLKQIKKTKKEEMEIKPSSESVKIFLEEMQQLRKELSLETTAQYEVKQETESRETSEIIKSITEIAEQKGSDTLLPLSTDLKLSAPISFAHAEEKQIVQLVKPEKLQPIPKKSMIDRNNISESHPASPNSMKKADKIKLSYVLIVTGIIIIFLSYTFIKGKIIK